MSHEDGHWGRALQAEGRVKITTGMEVRAKGGLEDDIREAWEEAVHGLGGRMEELTFYWAVMGRFWAEELCLQGLLWLHCWEWTMERRERVAAGRPPRVLLQWCETWRQPGPARSPLQWCMRRYGAWAKVVAGEIKAVIRISNGLTAEDKKVSS